MSRKVFILGVDGAPLRLLRDWAEKGALPTFARLFSEGAYGDLESVYPPVTAPAWTSFLTGRNPGKHGISDWYARAPGSYRLRPVDSTYIKSATMWDEAREGGRKVVSLGLPMNYPPPQVDGIIVSGLESPGGKCYSFPESIQDEVARVVPEFRTHLSEAYRPGRAEPVIKDLLDLVDVQSRLAKHFLRTAEWDLFVLQQQASDWSMHFFWHCMDSQHPRYTAKEARLYGDVIQRVFRRIDDGLGEILELLPPDTDVVVVSDHGFGSLEKFVFINNWLMQLGLLHLKKDPATRVKRVLFDLGITPDILYRAAERLGMNKLAFRAGKALRYNLLSTLFLSQNNIDWSRTKAYSVGSVGQVYVNLKGREPEGVVEPGGDYEAVRDQIISAIPRLADPDTGETVISRAVRKEEMYHGPYLDTLPDVLLFTRDFRYQGGGLSEFMSNRLVAPSFAFTGTHRMEGVLMAYGPSIKPGPTTGASILDIAPTVLHLLGLPVPEDMDGRVLVECLSDGASQGVAHKEQASAQADRGTGYSREDELEIAQRLRDLGYIE